MTDLERVINAIECRLDINHEKYKHCLSCQYRDDIDHLQWACMTNGILEDALSLLKAQEPVEPKIGKSVAPVSNTAVRFVETYWCGECGEPIEKSYQFCHKCGKEVKWNDET